MRKPSLFYLFQLLLVTSGCGPVYELRDHYSPPLDPNGQHCIRHCESRRSDCRQECDRAYTGCARDADEEADDAYSRALEVYAAQIETYGAEHALYDHSYQQYRQEKSELDHAYDHAKHRCRKREPGACAEQDRIDHRRDDLRDEYYGYGGPLYKEPDKPEKPTLDAEIDRFRALRCDAECGCQDSFKSCYVSCGGKVETLRYCVENCD